jgi:PEP-CTERM motif
MNTNPTRSQTILSGALSLLVLALSASGATVSIVNGGFDSGTEGSSTITGWTTTLGATGFWLQDGLGTNGSFPQDPSEPQAGTYYLTANRLAGAAGSQPTKSTLSQTITLDTTNQTLVTLGTAEIMLHFYYQDTDSNDSSSVSLSFLNSSSSLISTITTGTLANIAANGTAYSRVSAPWTLVNLSGQVPTDTVSVQINISTNRAAGTSTNVHFDSFSSEIVTVPEPSSAALLGLMGFWGLARRRR